MTGTASACDGHDPPDTYSECIISLREEGFPPDNPAKRSKALTS